MPALLTRMSSPPSSFHALSIIASTSARFATSPFTADGLAAEGANAFHHRLRPAPRFRCS
jgi:hypothetical protein